MFQDAIRELAIVKTSLPIDDATFDHSIFSYDTIHSFAKDCILKINMSIINGEYITIDIKGEGKQFNLELDQLEFDTPHLIKIKEFLDIIRAGVNLYLNFYADINNFYALGIVDFKPYFPRSTKEIKFLEFNIKVNLVDNNFTSGENTLKHLFRLKNELTKHSLLGTYSEIRLALETKLNFLIYKWYLRTAQKEKTSVYDEIILKQKRTLQPTVFGKWTNKIENHYEISENDWKSYFTKEYKNSPIVFSNLANFSFLSISNNIKYFKDVKEDENSLKSIVVSIESKIQTLPATTSQLEKFSYDILLNYSINNYYSCFCDKILKKFKVIKTSNDKKIVEKCKRLIDSLITEYDSSLLKIKGNVNNFFLDYKITYTCLEILNTAYEVCIDKLLFIETFDDDVNSKFNLIIENYKIKKKWSISNNNYIFKLDLSESKLHHNNLDVYYASSFILAKVDDDVESRFEDVYSLYSDIKLRFTLKYEIETIHSLSEEFKKDNKRIIEVVTLFTAIISFVVGSISAFESAKNFIEVIIILLSFGLALSIFVLLMYLANSKLNSARKFSKINTISFYENKGAWFGIKYPVFNYRLIRNVITILLVYSLFIYFLYYLFQYQSSIHSSDTPKITKEQSLKNIPQKQTIKTTPKL